jgi:hypothetical protein
MVIASPIELVKSAIALVKIGDMNSFLDRR